MQTYRKWSDIDLVAKRVVIREDFNVPIEKGVVTSDARIRAALPSLQALLDAKAHVIVLSHLGRPQEGRPEEQYSLAPVGHALEQLLQVPVTLISNWLAGFDTMPGRIFLCENVRFEVGEEENSADLSKKMASLCDVFIMDAFAVAHRKQASTYGIAVAAPVSCAGPLLCQELEALTRSFAQPKRPLVGVIGGSKISTKISVLRSLMHKADCLIIGGGMANPFLAAKGIEIGKSLCKSEDILLAKELMQVAQETGCALALPSDGVVSTAFSATVPARTCDIEDIQANEALYDIGPLTAKCYADLLMKAGTIIWNGPVGVFELAPFAQGTKAVAEAIASSPAYAVAGGGDTLAALDQFHVADKMGYVSTGGGAFLEWLEGKSLPGVDALLKD